MSLASKRKESSSVAVLSPMVSDRSTCLILSNWHLSHTLRQLTVINLQQIKQPTVPSDIALWAAATLNIHHYFNLKSDVQNIILLFRQRGLLAYVLAKCAVISRNSVAPAAKTAGQQISWAKEPANNQYGHDARVRVLIPRPFRLIYVLNLKQS